MLLNDDNFEMQGGVRNYLGKTEEVKAPKYWKSSKDSPSTELAYITEAEKGLLLDANLHGSLKNGKPNVGASGLLSYDGWGDSDGQGGSDTSGGNAGAEGGQGDGSGGYNSGNTGREQGAERNRSQTTTAPKAPSNTISNNNKNDNNYKVPDPVLPPGVTNLNPTDIDAEDEYLAPDTAHYKATQKAIGEINQELRDQGLDKSDYTDWTTEEQETYQKEMNKLNNTKDVNYSFYKGNKGTTNLTFEEHFKDVAATNPTIAKFSPTLRLLVAAGRTIKENATTDYGTGNYGGAGTDGSGEPVDQGGWIGRIFNSDGTVNENITDSEANDIYNQIQPDLPFMIGGTEKPDSMVNNYFANLNNTNLGISQDYLNTYNAAKTKMANTLNMTPPNQQFGYGNTYNDTYARKMNNTNVFYNYLNEQGLI